MVRWALARKQGPIALRYPRGTSDVLSETPAPIEIGKAETLLRGDDWAFSPTVPWSAWRSTPLERS
jgi:deoxyxylulose-5-phosphate synthase